MKPPELIPSKQGLKLLKELGISWKEMSSRTHSIKTRIETKQKQQKDKVTCKSSRTHSIKTRIETSELRMAQLDGFSSRTHSIKTRIETRILSKRALQMLLPPELIPSKQGLKL